MLILDRLGTPSSSLAPLPPSSPIVVGRTVASVILGVLRGKSAVDLVRIGCPFLLVLEVTNRERRKRWRAAVDYLRHIINEAGCVCAFAVQGLLDDACRPRAGCRKSVQSMVLHSTIPAQSKSSISTQPPISHAPVLLSARATVFLINVRVGTRAGPHADIYAKCPILHLYKE